MPKLKNILIFVAIAAVFVLVYIFFIRKGPETPPLVSSTGSSAVPSATAAPNSAVTQEFLTLLLSVRSLKLDSSIFSDPSFKSLHDSSITLTPDGTEGRPNPFAPLGSENNPVAAGATGATAGTGAGATP